MTMQIYRRGWGGFVFLFTFKTEKLTYTEGRELSNFSDTSDVPAYPHNSNFKYRQVLT